MPAHDVRGNLVGDAVRKDAAKTLAPRDRVVDCLSRLGSRLGAVQKAEVLGPGNIDQQRKAVVLHRLQQPDGRKVVQAQGIDRCLGHALEVVSGLLRIGKWLLMRVGREGTIGDALDAKLLLPAGKELAVDPHALTRGLGIEPRLLRGLLS